MRGVGSNYHHYTCFFIVSILFLHVFSIYSTTLSSTESVTISNNQTIVSVGDVFELGLFNPQSPRAADRWYLGIWYRVIPERTYVWVANRDNPLSNAIGTLKVSNNNLVLLDQSDIPVWSTNLSGVVTSPLVAELLANGNFVLRDSKINGPDGFLWQSFDFPSGTLLPGMKLGWDLKKGLNIFLRAWKNYPYDPSSGDISYKLEIGGLLEFFILDGDFPIFRSGRWDGIRFSGMPDMKMLNYSDIVYIFTESREEASYSFRATKTTYSRVTMSSQGLLQLFWWSSKEWTLAWYSPKEKCDFFRKCGAYSYCDISTSPVCNCNRGFEPHDGSGNCVRKRELSCNGDGFYQLTRVKLPDTRSAIVDKRIGLKECEERCLRNCNCTAFANTNTQNGGSGCLIWTTELADIRRYPEAGQDLYIKVAAADLDHKSNTTCKIISLTVGISVLLLLCFIVLCIWKRKRKRATETTPPNETVNQEKDEDVIMNQLVIPSDRT